MSAGNSIRFGLPRIKRCNSTGIAAAASAPRKSENVVNVITRGGIAVTVFIFDFDLKHPTVARCGIAGYPTCRHAKQE
jgi:hypothetical protein